MVPIVIRNNFYTIVRAIGQMLSVGHAGTLFPKLKDLISFLYQGENNNSMAKFLKQVATGDVPFVTGPLMENTQGDTLLFIKTMLAMGTEDINECKRLNISFCELIASCEIDRCFLRIIGP